MGRARVRCGEVRGDLAAIRARHASGGWLALWRCACVRGEWCAARYVFAASILLLTNIASKQFVSFSDPVAITGGGIGGGSRTNERTNERGRDANEKKNSAATASIELSALCVSVCVCGSAKASQSLPPIIDHDAHVLSGSAFWPRRQLHTYTRRAAKSSASGVCCGRLHRP